MYMFDHQHAFNAPYLNKLIAIVLGGCATFALFILMAKLIETNETSAPPVALEPIGNIVFEEPDEKIISRTKIKPIKEVPPPPITPTPLSDPITSEEGFAVNVEINNTIDKITLSPNLGISGDGSARPIVRVTPKYPPDAAQKGLQGWVALSFNIAPDGSVVDIQVVDGQPKKVFNREAIRALKKWKYKPSFENGRAVTQQGMQVVLDFKLDS